MNKKIKGIALLICSLAVILLFGFTPDSSKEISMELDKNPKFHAETMPTKSEVVKEKFSVDSKNLDSSKLKLNLNIKKTKDGKGLKLDGNGVLKIDNNTYPFTIEEKGYGVSSEIGRVEVNGQTYYKGIFQGYIKNKKSDDIISIVSYFTEDMKQMVSNVIVGTMGNDIYMSFGDNSFLTKELNQEIETKFKEKQVNEEGK